MSALLLLPDVYMFALQVKSARLPSLLCRRFVLTGSLPDRFLPNISTHFLFLDENVNNFLSLFLSFKTSFYLVIVSFSLEKNAIDK